MPGGVPERGPTKRGTQMLPAYPFSYSVNYNFTGYARSGRLRLSRVVQAPLKAMVIEEDTTAINDGAWHALNADSVAFRYTAVSVLHDKDREMRNPIEVTSSHPDYWWWGRGNVVFADAHGELFERGLLNSKLHADPRWAGSDRPLPPQ